MKSPRAKVRPSAQPSSSDDDSEGHDSRVLSLLMLLLSTHQALPRAEIFARMPDYQTDDPAAGQRKFERDKKLLRDLGVVIEEDSDDERVGYHIDPRQYLLPPVLLQEDEKLALALGAESLRQAQGLSYADLVDDALRKLSFSDASASRVRLPGQVAVRLGWRSPSAKLRRTLRTLEDAVTGRKKVTLDYQGYGAPAQKRVVDPYHLVFLNGDWLLLAYCHLREDIRSFRVDRIDGLKVAGKPESADFERPKDFSVAAYIKRSPWLFSPGGASAAQQVVLDVGPARPWILQEDFGPNAHQEIRADGWTRISFATANLPYVQARVLESAGHLRVQEPAKLKDEINKRIRSLLVLMEDPQ